MIKLLAWLFLMTAVYLIAAFIAWSLDPTDWLIFSDGNAPLGRFIFLMVGIGILAGLKKTDEII